MNNFIHKWKLYLFLWLHTYIYILLLHYSSKDKETSNYDVCNDPNILYKRWLIRNISKPDDTYPINYIIKEIRSLEGTESHLQTLRDLVDKNIYYKNNSEVIKFWYNILFS